MNLLRFNRNGIKELTISADGILESFSAVEKIVASAPELRYWQVNAFRQRVQGDDMEITYDSLKISYTDVKFKYNLNDGKIYLELFIKNYQENPDYQNAVYILLDALIGEYDMGTKISRVSFNKSSSAESKKTYRLIVLRKIVDDLKKNIKVGI